MNALELLRFGWTPNQLKLLLVALADAGPVERRVWVARSGVPRNHLAAVLAECERLGGARVVPSVEGLAIHVQPVEFWRVTPLMEREPWAQVWRGVTQSRLDLATERPGLVEAWQQLRAEELSGQELRGQELRGEELRVGELRVEGGENSSSRTAVTVREACPDSGRVSEMMPGIRAGDYPESGRPSTRDREVIEKDRSFSRVARDRGASQKLGRDYLLTKLRRIPRLEAEVMRPQTDGQRRMSRIFWELDQTDGEWLERTLSDLADNTAILNKSSWFNTAASAQLKMRREGQVTA